MLSLEWRQLDWSLTRSEGLSQAGQPAPAAAGEMWLGEVFCLHVPEAYIHFFNNRVTRPARDAPNLHLGLAEHA